MRTTRLPTTTGSDAKMACSATRLTTRWLVASLSNGRLSGRFLFLPSKHGGVCQAAIWQVHHGGRTVSLSSWTRGNVVTLGGLSGEMSLLTVIIAGDSYISLSSHQ